MDAQQEPRAQDEVDLGGLDVAAVAELEEHDVDDVVERLDLRPLVALDDVLGDQRVEAEGLGERPDVLR